MLMPSVFGKDLFDDFFDFPFYDNNEMDKLEKTELDVRKYNQTEDNYMPWALLLLALLLIDIIARHTVLRNIP